MAIAFRPYPQDLTLLQVGLILSFSAEGSTEVSFQVDIGMLRHSGIRMAKVKYHYWTVSFLLRIVLLLLLTSKHTVHMDLFPSLVCLTVVSVFISLLYTS